MNTSTSTTAPNVTAPSPMLPTRWVLTGSPLWCAALQKQLDASADPMLRWRLAAGLVTLVPLQAGAAGDPLAPLHNAIGDALCQGTTLLRLLAEPPVEDAATAVLAGRLDEAPGVQGAAGAAQAPFAALLQALAMPEAQALAHWLSGPRNRHGVQAHPFNNDSLLQRQADAALAGWLDGWLEGTTAAELDDIYGPANTGHLHDQGATTGTQVPPGLAPAQPARRQPGLLAAAAAAGATPGHGASGTPRMPLSGRITGALGQFIASPAALAVTRSGAAPNRYTLQWPVDGEKGWPAPVARASVQITLNLEADDWRAGWSAGPAGHRPRQLGLYPASRLLPVLVPLDAAVAAAGQPPAAGRWVLQATVEMDRADFIGCVGPDAQVDLVGGAPQPAPAR